ncbi:MAG: CHAT domain-containing protein [Oscillatoriales cyanobacterium]|nr:MAG: CHAT domain-containing protein [Oscillatoriales cyanobacterium]
MVSPPFPLLPSSLRWVQRAGVVSSLMMAATFGEMVLAPIASALDRAALPNLSSVAVELPSTRTLVDAGLTAYEQGAFITAIEIWEQALETPLPAADVATIQSNLAAAYQAVGQSEQAAIAWDQAIDYYETQPGSDLTIAQLLIEQAQSFDTLGQHKRAIEILERAISLAESANNSDALAAANGALGNAQWAAGEYEKAIQAHRTSLEIARETENVLFAAIAYNNLGNVYESQVQRFRYQLSVAQAEGEIIDAERYQSNLTRSIASAIDSAQRSVAVSQQIGGIVEARALLNLNRILALRTEDAATLSPAEIAEIEANRDRAIALLEREPASRNKAFALINAATDKHNRLNPQRQALVLRDAVSVSREIGDRRAESFALGSLGSVYEQNRAYDEAMALTQQAQIAAQEVDATDSLYRWQWQTGRIRLATGNQGEAIESYRAAIGSLQSIRGDIVAANKDIQFDFRDTVEPVYRELISQLLSIETVDPAQKQANLREVLDVLELLKIAELQNFFGDDCVEVAQSMVEANGQLTDRNAAAVYSIILPDRTELIVRLADGSLLQRTVDLSQAELETQVDEFRRLLEKRGTNEYLTYAQSLYRDLFEPIAADLSAAAPETLVFIQDGVLRKIPMAALHDGNRFLIENYAIATTPSLQLTSQSNLEKDEINALILGLTVARPPFAALAGVAEETQDVYNRLGGEILLDRDFTLKNFEAELGNDAYTVVHMATHGRFGVDSDTTFLLAYDDKITIDNIDTLLRSRAVRSGSTRRQPIELLTLSACQTAAGDNRAALGIAGVAVRAGAKSALASLWFINDASTVALIDTFYAELSKPGVTKAQALQRAQIAAINDYAYEHPAVWSPFIMIGNWL